MRKIYIFTCDIREFLEKKTIFLQEDKLNEEITKKVIEKILGGS
ncbi:MAG: hypothetical protein NZ826_04660 [Thermodesulfovibrio sp.]|nr:hypothetical protein [Thermodesulfovibrio sp.]